MNNQHTTGTNRFIDAKHDYTKMDQARDKFRELQEKQFIPNKQEVNEIVWAFTIGGLAFLVFIAIIVWGCMK